MAFAGQAFYAMWNDMDSGHVAEFGLMHARNHMAAHVGYLGKGEILSARRHGDGVGTLPPFFTFYDMRSLDVLTSPEHQHRRVAESAWFLRLRPHYRDHIRHHCRVVARSGAGLGGSIATLLMRVVDDEPTVRSQVTALCADLVQRAPITAAHFGIADPTVPTLVGGMPPPRNPDEEPVGVLVLESYDRHALAGELPDVCAHVVERRVAAITPRYAHYALSLAFEFDELGSLAIFEEPPA